LDEIIIRESEYAFIERRPSYIYVRYKDLIVIDLDGVIEHGVIFRELCNGKVYPLIVDATDMDVRMTYGARIRTSISKDKSKTFSCQAIITNTTPTILFTNFLIKNHEPGFPIKSFSNLADAERWVAQFKIEKVR
jgi:hypothetical protein